jgi:hypothetical protein
LSRSSSVARGFSDLCSCNSASWASYAPPQHSQLLLWRCLTSTFASYYMDLLAWALWRFSGPRNSRRKRSLWPPPPPPAGPEKPKVQATLISSQLLLLHSSLALFRNYNGTVA